MGLLASMTIDKWYLDAVADDGSVIIAYHTIVTLGGVPMGAASVMHFAAGIGEPVARTTVRAGVSPVVRADGRVEWANDSLEARVCITPGAPPLAHSLLRSEAGGIDWRADVPSGNVDVELAGQRWRGRGYAERMRMTIPPWDLPIQRLHWGRWIGPSAWAVWIRWEGEEERSLVWDAGGPAAAADIECGRVTWTGEDRSGRELSLDRGKVLRDGPIGGEVLQGLPLLKSLAPARLRRVLGIRETKWLSRGGLCGTREQGWAIHELVSFPGEIA